MHLPALRSVAVIVVMVGLFCGSTTKPQRVLPADVPHFEDLYERALRDIRGFEEPLVDEVYFISMGVDETGDYIDPPPQFVARFDDLKVKVLAVSQARWIRWGTREPRFWRVEDPETGKRGRIYFIVVNAYRVNEEKVSIDVGFANGGGRRAVYRLDNGVWVLDRVSFQWVS